MAAHVGVLVVAASWWLGGQTEMGRVVLSAWASLGALLTIAIAITRRGKHSRLTPLSSLWPLLIFDALAMVSIFNPSSRELTDGQNTFFVVSLSPPRWPWLPSSARPDLTLQGLWFFNAVYLAAFNLLLVVRRRRTIRVLLSVLLVNAAALAVMGSLQKLLGSRGIYFGAVKSPQPFFFASFIYHNHWGAFALLMLGSGIGLAFHHARRSFARDFWHSSGMLALVAVCFVAASLPLSTSRSATVLAFLMLVAAAVAWLLRLLRRRRHGEQVRRPALFAMATLIALLAFAYQLAEPIVRERFASTRQQIGDIRAHHTFGSRATLYRDTWRLARDKACFGWGMESYPTVFLPFNTQNDERRARNDVPMYFQDAHSDWLQSVAEVGFVGTALLGLAALVPYWRHRGPAPYSPIVLAGLLSAGGITLYAWVEFPFGNRAVVITWWVVLFSALAYSRLGSRTAAKPCSPSSS